ncbi:hypothetical protein F511_08324 [Dorcoceras hygrometricum]|uniref:Uncharacterized protein n=1 Tax=Dorcoceras hygrometricum TaxID=472368 RepID=A0A2Z7D7S3_9LAMI|nr:hypothetical protein F511_08324 [Dorcoceras hygrometricum]
MTSSFLLLRRASISNDDVTISRWIRRSAKEKLLTYEKNKGEVEVAFSSKLQYIQSQATVQPVESYSGLLTSRWNLMLAVVKRCRLDKWIRQRFAFALRFSRWILR